MSGIENRGLVVAGIGAGSLDYFLPIPEKPADVWPGHEPGGKRLLIPEQITYLESAPGLEAHIGGNAVNSLAWIAMQESVTDARLLTTVGRGDVASEAIIGHLPRVGINGEHVLHVDGYLPSIAAIEHESKGADRMVRSRARGPMGVHMTDEYLKEHAEGSDLVLAASLKDTKLMERAFVHADKDTFLSFNPSMTEIDDPQSRADMLRIMHGRNVDLLAVNETELPKMLSAYRKDMTLGEIEELANGVSEVYAKNVLCTLGKHGLLLASNGASQYLKSKLVPKDEIGTTLGAGDRSHAIAALRLKEGVAPEAILEEIADSTARLVRANGAHQDLYDKQA